MAQNRRARHDYDILETYEAGIVLVGSEVKSFREGKVQLRDSFAKVQDGELWLYGMHVSPYGYASAFGLFDPDRQRKLLLHRREINELDRQTRQARSPWYHCRRISRTAAPKSRSHWPGAGAPTTSGAPSPSVICNSSSAGSWGRGGPALGVIDEETPKRASGRPPTIAGPTVTRPVTSEGSGKAQAGPREDRYQG